MSETYAYLNFSILLIYCLISFIIGWRNTKNVGISLENYAVGYSSIATPILISGILASALGAGGILGNMSNLFTLGFPFVIIQTLKPFSWWISSKIFPRNLSALKAEGCISISHVMHHLYGSTARWITTILTFLTDLGIITTQMLAVSYIMSKLFLLPGNVASILSFVMIMTFSLMGGIRTIAQTGIFQFSLFFVLFPISYVLISYQHGGFHGLDEHLSFINWGATETESKYLLFLAIYALVPHCGSSFIQKCLIARNKKQLEGALKMVGQIYIPIMISLWFIAYAVKAVAPDLAPDQTLFYYINEMCPVWVRGLLSASLIAIIMGMSDGILHANSVIFANDVVKVLRPKTSETHLIYWAKGSIVALSYAAFYLSSASKNIIDVIWTMDSFWFPIILVPICAGFAGVVTDKKSFICSAILATGVIAFGYSAGLSSMAVFGLGLLGSLIGFFGGHILIKSQRQKSVLIPYSNSLKIWVADLNKTMKTKIIVLKTRIMQDLFPMEEQMVLGQKQIYPKFCVSMITLFFIYAVLMDKGEYYRIMGILLSVGYITATVLMSRDIIFRTSIPSKVFYTFWYGLLIVWSAVSGYALMSGNALVISIASLSLITLIMFTNAITYLFSIALGFAISAFLYKAGVGEVIPYQFYLTGTTCLLVGFFFLRPQEELIKDRFAEQQMIPGTMAHELTSPQAAAEMSLEMVNTILKDGIRKNLKDDKVSLTFDTESLKMLETFVSNALKSTKSGIKIVKMLLMVSKTGKVELPKKNFNVNKCVQKAVQSYVNSNKSAAGKIIINVDENWQMYGPEDFIEQAVHNHVKNSFIHGGKADLKVMIYNTENQLIIEDNGVGIPAQYLPFIFDKFFTKSSTGTGIGLAFSKQIAESMGGTITCETQTGEGSFTRFVMTIPSISEQGLKDK